MGAAARKYPAKDISGVAAAGLNPEQNLVGPPTAEAVL